MSQTSYEATETRSTQNRPPTSSTTPHANPTRHTLEHAEGGSVDDLERRAQGEAESIRRRASEQTESLKRQASEAAEMAKQKAIDAGNQAKATTRQYATEKKARVADEIGVFSGAIRKAAVKLHEEKHDSIACYADAAAEQLDQLRQSLESKEIGQIVDEVQHFARRRPELVYGGMFVAGLAAMRFLKASHPSERDSIGGSAGSRYPDSRGYQGGRQRDLNDHSQRPLAAFGHQPVELRSRQSEPITPVANSPLDQPVDRPIDQSTDTKDGGASS